MAGTKVQLVEMATRLLRFQNDGNATSCSVHPNPALLTDGHTVELLVQLLPIIGLHLRILYTLQSPILIPSANVILRLLKNYKFVSYAFFDEDPPSMLGYD
jgi:hypothetical protein